MWWAGELRWPTRDMLQIKKLLRIKNSCCKLKKKLLAIKSSCCKYKTVTANKKNSCCKFKTKLLQIKNKSSCKLKHFPRRNILVSRVARKLCGWPPDEGRALSTGATMWFVSGNICAESLKSPEKARDFFGENSETSRQTFATRGLISSYGFGGTNMLFRV